jgi:hypothetical protein
LNSNVLRREAGQLCLQLSRQTLQILRALSVIDRPTATTLGHLRDFLN